MKKILALGATGLLLCWQTIAFAQGDAAKKDLIIAVTRMNLDKAVEVLKEKLSSYPDVVVKGVCPRQQCILLSMNAQTVQTVETLAEKRALGFPAVLKTGDETQLKKLCGADYRPTE